MLPSDKSEKLSLTAPRSGRSTCDGDNSRGPKKLRRHTGGLEWRFIWICSLRLGRFTFSVTPYLSLCQKEPSLPNPERGEHRRALGR